MKFATKVRMLTHLYNINETIDLCELFLEFYDNCDIDEQFELLRLSYGHLCCSELCTALQSKFN